MHVFVSLLISAVVGFGLGYGFRGWTHGEILAAGRIALAAKSDVISFGKKL